MPNIRVKLFANLREITGAKELEMNGSTVGDILKKLCRKFPEMEKIMFDEENIKPYVNVFLNGNNVLDNGGLETMLKAGDEMALFPPVSGG